MQIILSCFSGLACSIKAPGSYFDKVPAPEITSFSINGIAGVISSDTIKVPFKWGLTATSNLVATFAINGKTVGVNGVAQVSGLTANDYTTAKTYTVTGLDGSTRVYTVSVTAVFPFADTGQALCSSGVSANGAMAACPNSNVGAVQDGDFVNIPAAPSFTGPSQHAVYTNDYTTTDNVTGLVWKSCDEGLSGPACGTGGAVTYTLSPDTATPQCTALNSLNGSAGYAGRTNWRLPSIDELKTILKFDVTGPAIFGSNFPATLATSHWSSSAYAPLTSNALYVNFNQGGVGNNAKTLGFHVRCVAGEAAAYTPPRKDNGDGTVTDQSNNLIWQKCSMGLNNDSTCSGSATTATFLASFTYCQGLNLAGLSWRVPSANELVSLVDFTKSTTTINTTFFSNTVAGNYWSSSTYAGVVSNAWSVDFSTGTLSNAAKTTSYSVRCVATGS